MCCRPQKGLQHMQNFNSRKLHSTICVFVDGCVGTWRHEPESSGKDNCPRRSLSLPDVTTSTAAACSCMANHNFGERKDKSYIHVAGAHPRENPEQKPFPKSRPDSANWTSVGHGSIAHPRCHESCTVNPEQQVHQKTSQPTSKTSQCPRCFR